MILFSTSILHLLKQYQKKAVLLFLGLTLFLVGCWGSADDPPGVVLENVSFSAALDANANTAVSMDLIMIYDKNLLDTLKKMTAKQYFSGIDQIRLDNPEYLTIWRWEIVPGQVGNYSLAPQKKAWGILLFGDYQSTGDHRASVGAFSAVSIILKNKALKLNQDTEGDCEQVVPAVHVPLSVPLNTRTAMVAEEPATSDNAEASEPTGEEEASDASEPSEDESPEDASPEDTPDQEEAS